MAELFFITKSHEQDICPDTLYLDAIKNKK
jgi:hypothetical protein